MKKILLTVIALTIFAVFNTKAQQATSYIDEVKALGYVSGQGLACGAAKLDTFEMLARAIIITKALNNKSQAEGMYAYNNAKADAYFSKQMDGFYECPAIARRFDKQDIFKATLYADGSIKMPDGRVFSPRQEYDATILFKKDEAARKEAQAIYDKGNLVETGEISIKTDGSTGTIKVPGKKPTYKVEQPKAPTPLVPIAKTVSKAPKANKTVDSSGVRHIKRSN